MICGQNLFISPIGKGSISHTGAYLSFDQSLVNACSMVSFLPGYTSLKAASTRCAESPLGQYAFNIIRVVSTSLVSCQMEEISGCSNSILMLLKPSSSQNLVAASNTQNGCEEYFRLSTTYCFSGDSAGVIGIFLNIGSVIQFTR